MWAIFRDPNTVFNSLDKFTIQLVEDKDILTYQEHLFTNVGGQKFELHPNVFFVQRLLSSDADVEYFARKYNPWTNASSSLYPQSSSGTGTSTKAD